MKGKWISWMAVAGTVSVLLGCGSSSSTPGTGANTTSSVQTAANSAALAGYIERGDRLCTTANEAIVPVNERGAEIQRRHGGSPNAAGLLVPVVREGLRLYRHFLRHFERIPPPSGETAQVSAILAGLRKVGVDIERLGAALAARELAQVRAITSERETDHARVSAQELELGFKVCGQPASQPSLSG